MKDWSVAAEGGEYALTDAGRAYVGEHAAELTAVWQVDPT
jgi:hypothetical protein